MRRQILDNVLLYIWNYMVHQPNWICNRHLTIARFWGRWRQPDRWCNMDGVLFSTWVVIVLPDWLKVHHMTRDRRGFWFDRKRYIVTAYKWLTWQFPLTLLLLRLLHDACHAMEAVITCHIVTWGRSIYRHLSWQVCRYLYIWVCGNGQHWGQAQHTHMHCNKECHSRIGLFSHHRVCLHVVVHN